jgi:hypothetical protein
MMMKRVTTFIIGLSLLAVTVMPVAAATTTEKVCTYDSYGNQTCRDKITNVDTGVITYANETVTYSDQTVAYRDNLSQAEILDAGLPAWFAPAAGVMVALGAISFVLKRII